MPTKNLRSIDNIDTNDMNFKHLETTKDIVISPKNEYGDPQRPDATHKWSAKVSDGTNYVGDYAVKINATNIVVNSADFTKLPVGAYQLEVWEEWVDANGNKQRSIYPSPRQTIAFNIYANIPDQAEKEIKKIGFQDVVDQAIMNIGMNYVFKVNTIEPNQTATVVQAAADGKNYVTFNVPRGAKGDKGDQGVQGIQGVKGDPGDRGPDGKQGPKGDPGKPFSIAKIFPSKDALNGDGLSEGDFVMIASNVNDPNNADLYTWTGKEFKLIADLSGAQGIQGPQGPQGKTGATGAVGPVGPKGDRGLQGIGFNPTRIPSGGDLNTLTTGGVYSSMGGTNFGNLPNLSNKNSFTMMVYGDSNQGSQIIIDPITSIMYTRVARDNWKTWNDWAKVGEATLTNSLPNLFTSQTTPTFTVGDADSTQHLSAQRFSYVYGKECQPKSFVGIRPLKGDTIMQSCVIRVSDGATLDSRICYSFFNNASGHYTQHIAPTTITPLGNNEYRLSASYQIAEDDFQLKLMDIHNFGLSTAPGNGSDSWIEIDSPFASLVQSGGVVTTNLLQALNIDAKPGVTLTNGIGHRSVPAGNHPSYDDYRYNITLFEPSTRYRLTFVAWGSGVIRSYLYPAAVLSEKGDSRDGQKSWTLNKAPTQYSYEFDSLEQLGDDPQKTLLFRIPASDQAVDFSLDTRSVVLEKVGRSS